MVKPASIFLLAALSLPGLALPGLGPARGPVIARVAVPIEAPPWRGLLRVQTELGERCTGFLLSPAVAVTAAHCLYLPAMGHFLRPGSVHVLLRYRMGLFDAHARVRRFIVASLYDPRRQQATAGSDRALLVLDHRVAAPGDTIPLARMPPVVGTTLLLAGYGEDRDELAVRGPPCRVTALRTDAHGGRVIAHDCAATLGTSGAPLLVRDPAGAWRAVGVQIEARVGEAGGLASALPPPTRSGSSSDR